MNLLESYKATEILNKTKGQLEAEISEAIIKFEIEYLGRGPLETKSYIIDDLILVRLKGVLTQAENQLARTDVDPNGRNLIKQVRIELLERGRSFKHQRENGRADHYLHPG